MAPARTRASRAISFDMTLLSSLECYRVPGPRNSLELDLAGRLVALLDRVVAVVESDADDLLGVRG